MIVDLSVLLSMVFSICLSLELESVFAIPGKHNIWILSKELD